MIINFSGIFLFNPVSIDDDYSLEIWYFTALILFAGYLKDAEVAVDALSIW